MLLRTSQLIDLPVMSLQTGEEIAYSSGLVINPDNLRIIALELDGANLDERPAFLRIEDIRELGNIGFIVDSSEEFIGLDDVISIKNTYERHFQPIDMRVIDDQKNKLGKVYDTIFSTDSFTVEQRCVKRPLFLRLGDTELIIHRNQIVDIQEKEIIEHSPTIKRAAEKRQRPKQHTNPFTKPQQSPQPESSTTSK